MSISWLEMIGIVIIIIVGIFYLIRIVYNHQIGKKIWEVYLEAAEGKDLEVKKSLNVLSDWPNLFGELNGKKTYVHPDRGSRRSPAKTIFAVENKIELPSDIIINTSDVDQPKDFHELDIESINKYKLNIYSNRKIDEDQIEDIFTSEVAGWINELIQNNSEDFRAVIFESGLAMFSKFKIDLDNDSISENIEEFSKIIADMEERTSSVNEYIENPRMIKLSEGTKSSSVKALIPIVLLGVAGYLLYNTMQDFSYLFLNAGIIVGVVGLVKLYVFLYSEWKFQ